MATVEKKSRNTRQQKLILQALRQTDRHPTAEELYEKVREAMPRISLATVYRNLMKLERLGQAQVFKAPGEKRRYDGNVRTHAHFRCRNCKRFFDFDGSNGVFGSLERELGQWSREDFEVEDYRLELIGLCGDCR